MTNSRQRVYLDANVIIAYLADEAGRASVAAALLEDAQRGNIELLTSVLSVTEVAFIASDHASDASNADESAIKALWSPGSPIRLTDISIRIAERARSIIRIARSKGMRSVKPADAIHLASAEVHGCDRFFISERETARAQWDELAAPVSNGVFAVLWD